MAKPGWRPRASPPDHRRAHLASTLEHGAFVGASGDGRFSSAARKDYAAAAAVALTADRQAGQVYELGGDQSFTVAELAAEVSRQSGRAVGYRDLSAAAYTELLTGVGLPADLAGLLADADVAVSQGALFEGSRQLSGLIGRPTTPLAESVATALAA